MRSCVLSELLISAHSGYWGRDAGSSDVDARVIRNGDVQEDGIRWSLLPLRGFSKQEFNKAVVCLDDLIITTSGECGFVAHVQTEPLEPTVASNFVRLLRLDRARVFPRYLYHYGKSRFFQAALAPFIRGTTLKNLAFTLAAERVRIPLPSPEEQERIAAIFDKAELLRDKRWAAVNRLGELSRSVFLDTFGDPGVNPHGYPIRELSEFYVNAEEGTKCGPFGSALKRSEVQQSGVPLWNMDNITSDGQMQLPFRGWVSDQKARELASYLVQDGDILISRAGTVGKMCVVRSGVEKSLITTNLIRLRLSSELLPEFFVALMTYCKGRIGRLKIGPDGAFTHMSTGVLDGLRFPYPPLDVQLRWLERSRAVYRQKGRMTEQVSLMNEHINSMQARLFSGAASK